MKATTVPNRELIIQALNANWQAEMEGAATYRALAGREEDARRKNALNEMADSENHHASLWEKRLIELGAPKPEFRGPFHGKADQFAYWAGGQNASLRRIELEERRDVAKYGKQLEGLGDEASVAILKELIPDERRHSRTLRELTSGQTYERNTIQRLLGPLDPQKALDEMKARHGHKSPASWIGDAIYGVNDGLGAIFGIVSGVAGATSGQSHTVLLAGIAGGIASALSMGSGAYLAAKSEKEIYEAEMQRKRDDLDENPEEGVKEMTLVFQVKGLPQEDARNAAEHLAKDKVLFLKALAMEEMNLNEEALRNPIVSAVSGAASTALGALIPIIPFFFMHGISAVVAAAVISLLAHFAVGAAKTLITVRSWWSSGFEMTLVGAIEGVATFLIGMGLGRLGA